VQQSAFVGASRVATITYRRGAKHVIHQSHAAGNEDPS
jgi:hypothetical protein